MVRAKLRAKLRGTWSGFGIPLLPNYNASIGAAWLERGGQYIEAGVGDRDPWGFSYHAYSNQIRKFGCLDMLDP